MIYGVFSLLVANFIGGALSPIFVKLGVREIPPLTFTLLRFILAAIFIYPLYVKQKHSKLELGKSKLILLNALFFAANVALFSIAIQFTTVIMSQIIYTFVPILVGVFSILFLNEKISKNKIIGSTVAFLGLSFLISQSISKTETISLGTPLGNTLTFIAAFSWASYLVLSKKIHQNYSSITISFTSFISTVIILIFLIPFELAIRPLNIDAITLTGMISLFGVALFSSVVMIYLLQTGIKINGAFIASIFGYTAPFFAIISAIPILSEKLTPELIIGGILIIFGVFYATTFSQAQKYIKSKLYG